MQPQRRKIGADHRRAPGDIVTGRTANGDFIGRVVEVTRHGGCSVRTDDGRDIFFPSFFATQLRTLEEVDAPTRMTRDGSWLLDETPRAA